MSVRNRIEMLEAAIHRAKGDDVDSRQKMFVGQLQELSDAELDRLEEITQRVIELDGEDGFMIAPAGCDHLRTFIAHVDADEAGYFAQFAGGRNV